MGLAESLAEQWHSHIQTESPDLSPSTQESIVQWLLGEDLDRLNTFTSEQQKVFETGLYFRYQILQQRYLNVSPEKAYRNLIQRLGGLVILRQKIRAWVATSRDRQRQVVDVLQEVIQEMLNSDRYLQKQLKWISHCTDDTRLRNALLLTSLEEYCLRPIRNQPLLAYRFVNYLRRSQRGGITQVPTGEWVKQISNEITTDETEDTINLVDKEVLNQYGDAQFLEQQQLQRMKVKETFVTFLQEQVDPEASQWLQLYLQGNSQEAIAQIMNLPIKQVYRLREKVCYHSVRNFTLKHNSELVTEWLGTSLSEHRLGLTATQWQNFWESLTPDQRYIIEQIKAKVEISDIAKEMKWKTSQVLSEWTKLYFQAQSIRNQND
ncbi:MAG: HetZ-related protein 2 [Microcoleaceae cyanobacterium]